MNRKVATTVKKRDNGIKRLLSRLQVPCMGVCMVAVSLSSLSCRNHDHIAGKTDVLVSMGDSVLTVDDVVSRIPFGISAADSVELFRKIVDRWVEGMVLTEMAKAKLPENDEIERQVEDYRNRLIVSYYMRKMRDGNKTKVDADSVRAFYDAFHHDMISETPLVKGIYMKVAESTSGLDDLKRNLFNADDEGIDKLEKNWAGDALQYELFLDKWIDWNVIADQIPYRFYDPDAFLESTRNFETIHDGSVYLLHISEYLPTGSELPYDFAARGITDMFEQANMADYEEALVRSLVKKAMSEEKLVAVGYDPLSRRFSRETNKNENNSNK